MPLVSGCDQLKVLKFDACIVDFLLWIVKNDVSSD